MWSLHVSRHASASRARWPIAGMALCLIALSAARSAADTAAAIDPVQRPSTGAVEEAGQGATGEPSFAAEAMAALRGMGDYERDAVIEVLRELGREIDTAPAGKRVGEIRAVNLPPFGPDAGGLTLVNRLRWTTRAFVVEREVLLDPGQMWDERKIRESERNLRDPLRSVFAVIVPLRAADSREVDLLVVTRDIWTLRTNSDIEVQEGVITRINAAPAEYNFLGMRKQVGAYFDMDLGAITTGPRYEDPNIGGTHLRTIVFAGPVLGRESGEIEGSATTVELEYPIWSLDRRWGARIRENHKNYVARTFQGRNLFTYDAPETAEIEAVPWEYRDEQFSVNTEVVRLVGRQHKHELTLGHALELHSASVHDSFVGTDLVRAAFVRDVLPLSESVSGLALRYRLFRTTFGQLRNIVTYDITEDIQFGPNMTAELVLASVYLGSDRNFLRGRLSPSWTFRWQEHGFVRLAAVAGSRLEGAGPESLDLYESELSVTADVASTPMAGFLRVIGRASFSGRFNDRQNIVFPIGGQTGLRGYPIGAFIGPVATTANLELRTTPISIWFSKAGLAAYWDAGHAADSVSDLSIHHNIGVGLRVLVPQTGSELYRLDWAIPLRGQTAGLPGRISFGFGQAF